MLFAISGGLFGFSKHFGARDFSRGSCEDTDARLGRHGRAPPEACTPKAKLSLSSGSLRIFSGPGSGRIFFGEATATSASRIGAGPCASLAKACDRAYDRHSS